MDPRRPYDPRTGQYQSRGGLQGSNAYVSGSPPQQGTSQYLQNPTTAAPVGRGYQVQAGTYTGTNPAPVGAQNQTTMYGQFPVSPPGPVGTPPMNTMSSSPYSYQPSPYQTMPPMVAGSSRSNQYSPVAAPSQGTSEGLSSSVVDVPHIEKTAGGKYACPLPGCQEEYKDKSSATRHYRTKHGGPQERCSVCNREFPRGDSMQRHLKSQHGYGK